MGTKEKIENEQDSSLSHPLFPIHYHGPMAFFVRVFLLVFLRIEDGCEER